MILSAIIIFLLVDLGCVMFEKYAACTTISFIAFLVGVYYFRSDALPFLYANYLSLVYAVLAFLVIGSLWSFFKWFCFIKEKIEELENNKARATAKGWGPECWVDYVTEKMPKASESKSLIAAWIAYWPFSMASWVLKDFVEFLVTSLIGVYDRITKKILVGLYE